MFDPSNLDERVASYVTARGVELKHRLGSGKDGAVFSTTLGTALKSFAGVQPYQ